MCKRKLILILSLVMLCIAPLQVFAASSVPESQVISPMWVSITDFSNSFNISASGLAQFETSVYSRSTINKVVISASIQQYKNGSWQTLKSWSTTTYSNSGYLSQQLYVTHGYNYRLVSSAAVYQNNVLIEQTPYTGSSYWF